MLPKCKFTHEYLSNVNKEMIVNKQLKVNKLQLLDLDNLKVEMVPKLILNKLQLLDLDDHKHKFKVEMVPKCKI